MMPALRRVLAVIAPAIALVLTLASEPAMAQGSGNGKLKVNATPGRARVFVNGKYLGPAKNFASTRTYMLPAGEHEASVQEPRYKDFTSKVTITAGKTTKIDAALQAVPLANPPFGTLRIKQTSTDKFAAVYLNDKYYGHVDEFSNFAQGVLLNPGEYTLKIVPTSGGSGREEKVKIEANRTTIVKQ